MRKLNYELKQLTRRFPADSFASQRDREYIAAQIADQLYEAGYKKMAATDLRGRHIDALVQRWQSEQLSAGTIKNRMSVLRWWADSIGKKSMMLPSNKDYGIAARQRNTEISKARSLSMGDLEKVRDQHVRWSLELQKAFGLRREEAIKFNVTYADQGDHIRLKPSWTKGGKARAVPLTNPAQRELLQRLHAAVGQRSLIPADRRYVDQLRVYERETVHAGLTRMHGLRHAYAQDRYRALTGWPAPAAGGPASRALTPEQKVIDREARLTISRELGHEREQITTVYLGR